MAKTSIPYVVWRDGKPRFVPSPELRAMGYKGENLVHGDGRWFSRGEALDWAECRQREAQAKAQAIREEAERLARKKRQVFAPPAATAVRVTSIYTVARLIDDWLASPVFPQPVRRGEVRPATGDGQRAYRTMVDYRQKMRALEAHDRDLYFSAVEALDQPILVGLHDSLWKARGLHTANGVLRVLSIAISWGIRRGKVRMAINPAFRMGTPTPKPRLRFASRSEIEALVAAADAIGRPEIGDMIILGVWTGQRQADRLSLVHKTGPALPNRRVFRQQKTGAIVIIPESPELRARLVSSRARRVAAGILDRHVVLDERTWRPYLADWYRHVWDDVRAAAVNGVPAEGSTPTAPRWMVAPTPGLAGFRDQDLRDTAVTWMGLAGLTIPEICSITGHSEASAYSIMKHYLALHPDMASAGMAKLIAWYETSDKTEEMWR